MRVYSTNFNEKNLSAHKETRWTIEIATDLANTKLFYFTSHADCEVPPDTAAANIFYSVVKKPVVTSQKLDVKTTRFSIGKITFDLVDKDSVITNWLKTTLDGGEGLRHKRVRVRRGYKGLLWADYQLPPGGTQIIDGKMSYNKGTYTFRCNDIQRSMKTTIFDQKTTNLTAKYNAGDATITVVSTADFEMIVHGTSFTESPSATVGYIEIKAGDNINVIKYTGKTATTFTGCVGGRFNTKDVSIDIDSNATNDRQPEVKEFIYLEMPAPKLALAILTGTNPTLPSHWHMDIDSSFVASSQFNDIGVDLYDTGDDTKGFILRFDGLKKIDGKKFLQSQVNLPTGTFMPILADGQIGLKRSTGVVSGASPVVILDSSNVISYSPLDHDHSKVANEYVIHWNKIVGKDKPTRTNVYTDQVSINKHQTNNIIELSFDGLHGSRHTDTVLRDTFNALRDSFSGPPYLITVKCFDLLNGVEVGDIVWCRFNQRDFTGGGDVDRAFAVVGYQASGKDVTLNLFGSSQAANFIADSAVVSTVMANSFYSIGLVAGNKLDVATNGSLTGDVWHITADTTLTGGSDMTDTANIYWFDNDVILDSGVTLTLTQNVQFRVMGTFTRNGTINMAGQGLAGVATNETSGNAGWIGATKAGSAYSISRLTLGASNVTYYWEEILKHRASPNSAVGVNDSVPYLKLENPNGTSLIGIIQDMRPSSGGSGANVHDNLRNISLASGGAGGAGGASCLFICRAFATGAGGSVKLEGAKGSVGASINFNDRTDDIRDIFNADIDRTVYAGAGATGAPGVFYVLIDGPSAVTPSVSTFTALMPSPDFLGSPSVTNPIQIRKAGNQWPLYNRDSGLFGLGNMNNSRVRIQYIPASETAAPDVLEETSIPTAITIVAVTATRAGINTTSLEISVTPPNNGNYRGSRVEIAANGTNGWHSLGEVQSTSEVVFSSAVPGVTYNVRAYPISISGVESADFATASFAVNATLETVLAANHSIVSAPAPDTSGGIKIDSGGLKAYNGSGVLLTDISDTTGELIYKSSAAGQRIEINPSGDNEMHFWADRGDGAILEFVTIGISTSGGDTIVGSFGSTVSAFVGILAKSSHIAIIGFSTIGYGARFTGGLAAAPIVLFPSSSASAPTHTAEKGSLWQTSAGVLYSNTNGSDTWAKVGAQ